MDRKENIVRIRENIEQAAQRVGRDPNDVKLLAVSKVFSVEDIKSVYDLGLRAFGESRAQELRDKVPLLPQDIEWHFIGPLQKNKIKYVVPNAQLIHAVDSIKLAIAIAEFGRSKGIIPQILVEINSSGEKGKHGFLPGQALEAVLEINVLKEIEIRGLMTMAPYTEDTNRIGKSFSMLYNLFMDLKGKIGRQNFNELSMGMSGDYEIAVKEGSTIVRVGTGIFGPRRR